VEQIYQAAERLHAVGIQVGFFLQFGYPGETREDIERTLQMVRDCRPDDIGMSVSYPLPGTKFFERVQAELGDKHNWTDSDDLAMLYHGPYSTEFYRVLHKALHAEFRRQKTADRLRRDLPHPARWRPSHVRQAAAYARDGLRLRMSRRELDRLGQGGPQSLPMVDRQPV
jgi:anaerobic magnesium-protoporphyrin IX monomethyl ester cyclase